MFIESVVHKRVLRSGRCQKENINYEKNYGIASHKDISIPPLSTKLVSSMFILLTISIDGSGVRLIESNVTLFELETLG